MPTPTCPNRTVPPPEDPHPHPSPVSQDPVGGREEDPGTGTKEAGKEKDRDKHQGGGREKVHAREEGGPTESRGKVKKVPTRTGPCCTPSTRHCNGPAPHKGLHFHKK